MGDNNTSTADSSSDCTPVSRKKKMEDLRRNIDKVCGPAFSFENYKQKVESAVSKGEDPGNMASFYLYNPKQSGYFPQTVSETAKNHSAKDLKHYFHCYFPWGTYPDEVSGRARRLFDQMMGLGKLLLQWIDDNMAEDIKSRMPCPLTEIVSSDQTLLRILHYPSYASIKAERGENGVAPEAAGAVRAAPHEDINLITVLPAGSSKGLQVYSNTMKKWFEVPCLRGSMVINIGDMLQELTKGEYIATTHRVVKPEGECENNDRMAVPCFIHADPDAWISKRYPRAEDFLMERLRELGVI